MRTTSFSQRVCVGALAVAVAGGLSACAAEPTNIPDDSGHQGHHSVESAGQTPQSDLPVAPSQSSEPVSKSGLNTAAHSLDDPASIWVISNKLRPLQPNDWQPTDLVMPVGVENTNAQPLREPAARAIESMVQQAANEGIRLGVVSAFRDFGYQSMLYQNYVARDGAAAADTYSARPGHSEHQTGLAVDVDDFSGYMLNACFGSTLGGMWVAERAAEYGFVIRYPEGSDGVTGFTYEPWHLRYVGVELAQEMRTTGTATLEEFFGLTAAPNYSVH